MSALIHSFSLLFDLPLAVLTSITFTTSPSPPTSADSTAPSPNPLIAATSTPRLTPSSRRVCGRRRPSSDGSSLENISVAGKSCSSAPRRSIRSLPGWPRKPLPFDASPSSLTSL